MPHRASGLWIGVAVTALVALGGGVLVLASNQKESSMESSKRRAPTAKPVVHQGIRYEQLRGARARGFEQNGGVIAAIEVKGGKELWTLQVYKTEYDQHEERDAQDVYIEEMRIDAKANALILRDERGRSFSINLKDRSITQKR